MGGAHNIRVFRNRCFNSAGGALSAQPSFGGPTYFYQNVVYNATTGGPLKFLDTPAGVLCYQNTFIGQGTMIGPASNIHFLNNLFVGDDWPVSVFSVRTFTNYSTSDYNGFRSNAKGSTPSCGIRPPLKHRPTTRASWSHGVLESLKEYSEGTKQDRHSTTVDYNIFVNVKMPDATDPQRLYKPEDFDFRLAPGSRAIDAGVTLPSINEGFSGSAPDLGAYELDRPTPHYGPRSEP